MTRFHTLNISRRRFLGGAALGAGALAALAATPASAAIQKLSQKAALYQAKPKGKQDCSGCSQFQPAATCRVVDGQIASSGWCMLYAPK